MTWCTVMDDTLYRFKDELSLAGFMYQQYCDNGTFCSEFEEHLRERYPGVMLIEQCNREGWAVSDFFYDWALDRIRCDRDLLRAYGYHDVERVAIL